MRIAISSVALLSSLLATVLPLAADDNENPGAVPLSVEDSSTISPPVAETPTAVRTGPESPAVGTTHRGHASSALDPGVEQTLSDTPIDEDENDHPPTSPPDERGSKGAAEALHDDSLSSLPSLPVELLEIDPSEILGVDGDGDIGAGKGGQQVASGEGQGVFTEKLGQGSELTMGEADTARQAREENPVDRKSAGQPGENEERIQGQGDLDGSEESDSSAEAASVGDIDHNELAHVNEGDSLPGDGSNGGGGDTAGHIDHNNVTPVDTSQHIVDSLEDESDEKKPGGAASGEADGQAEEGTFATRGMARDEAVGDDAAAENENPGTTGSTATDSSLETKNSGDHAAPEGDDDSSDAYDEQSSFGSEINDAEGGLRKGLEASEAADNATVIDDETVLKRAESMQEESGNESNKPHDEQLKVDQPDYTTTSVAMMEGNDREDEAVKALDTSTGDLETAATAANEENEVGTASKTSLSSKKEEEDEAIARVVVDYASKSAGAIILEKSSSMKGSSNLLNPDRDRYAIAPCADKKFVVINLSEDIHVKSVVLSNYERYSSRVKDFQILGSQDMNTWVDLGTYTANSTNGKQEFDLIEPAWARYLKFRFVTHYGAEHYCTVSQIQVHGSTMLQGFQEQWRESEMEAEDLLVDRVEQGEVGAGEKNVEGRTEGAGKGSQMEKEGGDEAVLEEGPALSPETPKHEAADGALPAAIKESTPTDEEAFPEEPVAPSSTDETIDEESATEHEEGTDLSADEATDDRAVTSDLGTADTTLQSQEMVSTASGQVITEKARSSKQQVEVKIEAQKPLDSSAATADVPLIQTQKIVGQPAPPCSGSQFQADAHEVSQAENGGSAVPMDVNKGTALEAELAESNPTHDDRRLDEPCMVDDAVEVPGASKTNEADCIKETVSEKVELATEEYTDLNPIVTTTGTLESASIKTASSAPATSAKVAPTVTPPTASGVGGSIASSAGAVTDAVTDAVRSAVAEASDAIKNVKATAVTDAVKEIQKRLLTKIMSEGQTSMESSGTSAGNVPPESLESRLEQENSVPDTKRPSVENGISIGGEDVDDKRSSEQAPPTASGQPEELQKQPASKTLDNADDIPDPIMESSQDYAPLDDKAKFDTPPSSREKRNGQVAGSVEENHSKRTSSSEVASAIAPEATDTKNHKAAGAGGPTPTTGGSRNDKLLASINDRIPSAKCLEGLNLAEFKAKVKSRTAGAKPEAGSAGGPGGSRMEPIFKTLTDEIKALQVGQSVTDQYLRAIETCYQQVLADIAQELASVETHQARRLASLEESLRIMQSGRESNLMLQSLGMLGKFAFSALVFVYRIVLTIAQHERTHRVLEALAGMAGGKMNLVGCVLVCLFIFEILIRRATRWRVKRTETFRVNQREGLDPRKSCVRRASEESLHSLGKIRTSNPLGDEVSHSSDSSRSIGRGMVTPRKQKVVK